MNNINPNSVEGKMLALVREYSPEIYQNKSRFKGLVSDFLANEDILRLLKKIIDEGGASEVYAIKNYTGNKLVNSYQKLLGVIESKTYISKQTLIPAVDLLLFGLGVDCSNLSDNIDTNYNLADNSNNKSNNQGYINQGYNNSSYDNSSYDNSSYDNSSYNNSSYDNSSYDNSSYDNSSYDNSSYDNSSYNNSSNNNNQNTMRQPAPQSQPHPRVVQPQQPRVVQPTPQPRVVQPTQQSYDAPPPPPPHRPHAGGLIDILLSPPPPHHGPHRGGRGGHPRGGHGGRR